MNKPRTMMVLATAALLAAGTAAIAASATPDTPVKKPVKQHRAHKSATVPASDMYLRAAGSEPAPKASK